MAVAVLMNFQGGSKDAYDRVLEKMGLTEGRTPEGAIFHVAGEIDGGFRVVDVWDSAEQFQRFAEEQIAPLTREEGFPQPEVSMWEVHNTLTR
jgi:hypothetical protein